MLNRFEELPEVLELNDCFKNPRFVNEDTLPERSRPSIGVAPPPSCIGGSRECESACKSSSLTGTC